MRMHTCLMLCSFRGLVTLLPLASTTSNTAIWQPDIREADAGTGMDAHPHTEQRESGLPGIQIADMRKTGDAKQLTVNKPAAIAADPSLPDLQS